MWLLIAEWEQEQQRWDMRFWQVARMWVDKEVKPEQMFPSLAGLMSPEPEDDAQSFRQVAAALAPDLMADGLLR